MGQLFNNLISLNLKLKRKFDADHDRCPRHRNKVLNIKQKVSEKILRRGGGGQVVIILVFYSDDLSSNPAEVTNFYIN